MKTVSHHTRKLWSQRRRNRKRELVYEASYKLYLCPQKFSRQPGPELAIQNLFATHSQRAVLRGKGKPDTEGVLLTAVTLIQQTYVLKAL